MAIEVYRAEKKDDDDKLKKSLGVLQIVGTATDLQAKNAESNAKADAKAQAAQLQADQEQAAVHQKAAMQRRLEQKDKKLYGA